MIARIVLVVLVAAALAAFTYLRLERTGVRGWIPLLCRAVAGSALGFLLLNVSCPVAGAPQRPLVLLDASLSLSAPGARWREARDSAARWGEVRRFGDERSVADTAPSRGRSLLSPALVAASASARPVIVVTDGEIEDAGDLPADLLSRAAVRLFPRAVTPDLALTRISGPGRVTAGDSIPLEVEIQAVGMVAVESVTVELALGARRLAVRTLPLRERAARGRIAVSSTAVGAGEHVLRVSLVATGDSEARTDTRLHLVTVAPTPGVVLLAGSADWDSRFLYRTLREVAQLPVRGFARLDPERWRSMADLSVVPGDVVRQAARRADLLITTGPAATLAEGTTARGIWQWSAGADASALPGDWYLHAADASPVSGAFLGQPIDSFPPAIQLTPIEPAAGDWVGITAQLGRRGAQRPAVVGHEAGRTRRVTVAVDGLWRWAFRGGSSEQSYRTWVAVTASWLLGGADSVTGSARPVRPVVGNGRPVMFEWIAPGAPSALGIAWTAERGGRGDTLRFDGSGRAMVWLPPGEHRYRLSGGGGGIVAVEGYSDELLPRPVALTAHEAGASTTTERAAARDWLWWFALCVVALAAEWVARRRLGLR
ncbi:MAG TPA: hypothetical protein VMY76_00325 [Gemmatimonadales bacterium]|nr:hypothetical protein [Gemmatimonadales bacterium]